MIVFQEGGTYNDAPEHLGEDVALGRLHDVEGLADDDDDGGHQHQDGGDAKGEGVAGVVAEALNILPRRRFQFLDGLCQKTRIFWL